VTLTRRPLAAALLAAVLAGTVWLALRMPFPSLRMAGLAMTVVLAAIVLLAGSRWAFGPPAATLSARGIRAAGLAVILLTLPLSFNAVRLADHPNGAHMTTQLTIWTVMLALYAVATIRLTADGARVSTGTLVAGAGAGLAAAVVWLVACLLMPKLSTVNVSTFVAVAGAAAVAIGWVLWRAEPRSVGQTLIAAVAAAGTTALLIGVLMDGLLVHLPHYVANNHPPVWPQSDYHRLPDSISMWMLGALLSIVLLLVVRSQPPAGRITREAA
jgi:hypothetical protein